MATTFITLYGMPNVGKTVTAVSMAKSYADKGLSVVLILANNYTPKVPIIFAKDKSMHVLSLGELLTSPNLSEEMVLKSLIPLSGKYDSVCVLGYKNHENLQTYGKPIEKNLEQLFSLLSDGLGIDIVISVPIATFFSDALSEFMIDYSDFLYYLHECSPQSLSFFLSRKELLEGKVKSERQDVLTKVVKSDDTAMYSSQLGGIEFQLPYVPELVENFRRGNISSDLRTKEGKLFAAEIVKMCDYSIAQRRKERRNEQERNKRRCQERS